MLPDVQFWRPIFASSLPSSSPTHGSRGEVGVDQDLERGGSEGGKLQERAHHYHIFNT